MAMNAEQILALAGVFQSAALVQRLANGRTMDEAAQEASLASVFMIDADDVSAVFGGAEGVRLGLTTLVRQIDQPGENMELARMVLGMLQLERKLSSNPDLRDQLAEGIGKADRQRQHFDTLHTTVSASLGELYEQTLSQLRPRIMVSGDPHLLHDASRVSRIRANLLAGIRAAVLWHQLGGRRWQLLLQRKQVALLARGLLSRVTLDHGE
ncbi:MAG: high frequency lysogenization protein HflD [Rhodanobacteraceae bacterium]